MVRNEADIIESFVRHATAFADKIYIVNHNSTDGTRKILDDLVQEGLSLDVEDYIGAEQAQSEIMTDLMQKAFAERYDFVLPLDADEFLLPDGAYDMKWCSKALFTVCTPDKIYQLPWVTYQTADEYVGKKFILAEDCYREEQPESLGKLLVGRLAFEKTHFFLSQGNHHALIKKDSGLQRLTALPLQGIHLAHFSWRSCEQAASKAAVGWLANVAKYSKQTNLANHWRHVFYNLLEGKMPVRPKLKQGHKAVIHSNCQNILLRYTVCSNKVNVLLRNVLLAAQQLANDYSEEKARIEQHKVSVILPYFGQRTPFKESFAAALQEEYPYVNMIVFSLAAKEEDTWVLNFLQQMTTDTEKEIIYLQEHGEELWKDIAASADGEFIQWIFPGDLVVKHRLQHMVTTLVRHENIDLILTNSQNHPVLQREKDKGNIVDLQLPDGFAIGDGNIYRDYLRKNNVLLSGGLSSPLFRRSQMERLSFFRLHIQKRHLSWQDIWQAVLKDVVIGAIPEPLVEMHSQL
ncbi:glycosyltransferase family 2 protein [Selenomonas ruminantium]|uniref:glycosyltransferase family 2 protein n=1 Tax=Selenomonas ruminantium TaxID=971 RepID=UPI00047BB5FE|nr:glycosyltransferase family 2 protein [Selenomonas ruminantium]